MWDNPDALNRISRLILAATVLFTLWVAGRAVLDMAFPFRQVSITGGQHAETRAAAQRVGPHLAGGFFSMDLAATRAAFVQLPWVRQADVQRHWPGRLHIRLEEHRAAAAWNDRATLNTFGERFEVEPAPHLPRLYAPDGMEKILARHFGEFTQIVAPLGLRVEHIVVTARQSWRVRLSGGVTVELGRERVNERLARFASVYPQAVAATGTLVRVDMRYPNGFAAQISGKSASHPVSRSQGHSA